MLYSTLEVIKGKNNEQTIGGLALLRMWRTRFLFLFCQRIHGEVALRRNPEGIGNAIEERKQCCDVDGLRDLWFRPSGVTEPLDVLGGCAWGCLSDLANIIEQKALGGGKPGAIEVTFGDGGYGRIFGSLYTQEVGVRVQSIGTSVEI